MRSTLWHRPKRRRVQTGSRDDPFSQLVVVGMDTARGRSLRFGPFLPPRSRNCQLAVSITLEELITSRNSLIAVERHYHLCLGFCVNATDALAVSQSPVASFTPAGIGLVLSTSIIALSPSSIRADSGPQSPRLPPCPLWPGSLFALSHRDATPGSHRRSGPCCCR